MKKYKNIIVYISTIIFSIIFIIVGNIITKPNLHLKHDTIKTYTATVTKLNDVLLDEYDLNEETDLNSLPVTSKKILFTAKITSGDMKNQSVIGSQDINSMLPVNPKDVEEGDKIIVSNFVNEEGNIEWFFAEYHRSNTLIFLCIFFFALILIFGRKKGFNTIISLIFTCLAIFCVFVPSILKGMNIYISAIIVSIFIIFMTLLIVNGADKKTFCAIMGNIGGLAVTGLLTVILDKVMNLTGAIDEQSVFLVLLNEENPIDLKAIIFGAIIIGALGATMDVSMSIASALNELAENMDNRSFKTMLKSGFNIGKDAMSTMTNTLILAYIGSSLAIVLLLIANKQSLIDLFNREMIVVEIMQSLVGSIGILFTIPITSVLSAYVYNIKK